MGDAIEIESITADSASTASTSAPSPPPQSTFQTPSRALHSEPKAMPRMSPENSAPGEFVEAREKTIEQMLIKMVTAQRKRAREALFTPTKPQRLLTPPNIESSTPTTPMNSKKKKKNELSPFERVFSERASTRKKA